MRHGGRLQALGKLGFAGGVVGRRRSHFLALGVLSAAVVLALSGPAAARSGGSNQVADVPGPSWSGFLTVTKHWEVHSVSVTAIGTHTITFNLDGQGGLTGAQYPFCNSGQVCYVQPFTWTGHFRSDTSPAGCGDHGYEEGSGSGTVGVDPTSPTTTGLFVAFLPGDGQVEVFFRGDATWPSHAVLGCGGEADLREGPVDNGLPGSFWQDNSTVQAAFDAPTLAGSHFDRYGDASSFEDYTYVWSMTRYPDADHDGVPNFEDNCPNTFNPDQADADGDGKGDACDIVDTDGDGVPDPQDNCRTTANPGQVDTDADGIGDACDPDIDGDGTPNDTDPCPFDPLDNCDVGPPPPPPDTSCGGDGREAHRGVLTPEYDARIVLAFAPDEHLFRFSPTVAYCWDGSVSEIRSASALGDLDTGIFDAFEIVGQYLGFTLEYNPAAEQVIVHVPNNSADILGEFGVAFNITKLLDKLGLKSKVEGYVSKNLGKALAKLIEKKGYNTEFKNKIADFAAVTSEKIRREFVVVLDGFAGKVPKILKPLAKGLEGFVLGKVDAKLDSWRTKVNASLSAGAFTGWTSDQIGDALVSTLFAEIEEAVTLHFPLWDIDYQVAISSRGQITQILDPAEYKWPLLTIEEHLQRAETQSPPAAPALASPARLAAAFLSPAGARCSSEAGVGRIPAEPRSSFPAACSPR